MAISPTKQVTLADMQVLADYLEIPLVKVYAICMLYTARLGLEIEVATGPLADELAVAKARIRSDIGEKE